MNHLGYIDIQQKSRRLNYSLVLKIEGNLDYLTFEAFPGEKIVFTNNSNHVYYNINQKINTINVVAVNQNNIEGIPTVIKVKYE